MEVFRANLQLMEEQQITAAAVAMGQPSQPQPSALQVASAGSASASLGHQMSMSQPRLLLATDHAHNLHQLGTEMATPTPNPWSSSHKGELPMVWILSYSMPQVAMVDFSGQDKDGV